MKIYGNKKSQTKIKIIVFLYRMKSNNNNKSTESLK